MGAENKMLVV